VNRGTRTGTGASVVVTSEPAVGVNTPEC
jgi:hypothetical protein